MVEEGLQSQKLDLIKRAFNVIGLGGDSRVRDSGGSVQGSIWAFVGKVLGENSRGDRAEIAGCCSPSQEDRRAARTRGGAKAKGAECWIRRVF